MRAIASILKVLVPAVCLLLPGCASPEPVAIVRLAVDRVTVPHGAYVQATIRFDVSPTFDALGEDYRVFLHAFDDDGVFLWSDDHDPPLPTSEWSPGQSIQYTQRVKIPAHPYVGAGVIGVGLHSPTSRSRLALAGDDLGEFVYRVATLEFAPQHESSFVVHDEGWHPVEFDPSGRTWWWTTGRAVVSFRNPYRAARLLLDVQGRPDLFSHPQTLSLVVGGRTLREATLDARDVVHLDYELAATDFGGNEVVNLELLVDQTFVPAEIDGNASDMRELGVRVFDVYVEPLAVSP